MSGMRIYKKGLKDGIPICLGYIAVSFAFGIQAGKIGISALAGALMSLSNVTSAGQFAALSIISSGAPVFLLIVSQFVLNLRYLLMSCALSQKLSDKTGTLKRLLMAHGITDEIFALSAAYPGELNPLYTYGLMTVSIFGWCFGTVLGIISQNLLPSSIISALGIAIYGMFIAIVVPASKTDKNVLFCAIFAIIISCALKYVPLLSQISSGFEIIIATILAASLAAILFPKEAEGNE